MSSARGRKAAPAKRSAKKGRRPAPPANETGHNARAMWTGSIGFGLVQIPVRLLPREQTNDLAFHQIDKRDGALIGYERMNKNTHKAVEWGDIARAYEIDKGQFVIVTDDDFEKANVAANQTIEIQDFVAAAQIPPEFFDRPYFVLPDKRGSKAYGVLRDAMAKKGLAALGFVVLRTRQHLCAVLSEGNLLSLELLRFGHELRTPRDVASEVSGPAKASDRETALAEQLIERMVIDWEPGRYRDSYRDDLLSAIRHKAETGVLEPRNVPPPARATAIDLVELLQKSVAGARKRAKGRAA